MEEGRRGGGGCHQDENISLNKTHKVHNNFENRRGAQSDRYHLTQDNKKNPLKLGEGRVKNVMPYASFSFSHYVFLI